MKLHPKKSSKSFMVMVVLEHKLSNDCNPPNYSAYCRTIVGEHFAQMM
jgi:hypothetical protein